MAKKVRPTDKNLKPVRTKEEARERGRKGGIASGVARNRIKTAREYARLFVNLKPNDNIRKQIKALGVPDDSINNMMAMIVGVSQKAMKGDAKAFKTMNEMTGQDVKLNIDIERHKEELAFRERELQLRERELALREEEFRHRVALESGEVEQEDRVFIVNDLDEIKKTKRNKAK